MKQLSQLVRFACATGLLLGATPIASGHELAGVPHSHAGELAGLLPNAAASGFGDFAWLLPFALCVAAMVLAAGPRLRRAEARAA